MIIESISGNMIVISTREHRVQIELHDFGSYAAIHIGCPELAKIKKQMDGWYVLTIPNQQEKGAQA